MVAGAYFKGCLVLKLDSKALLLKICYFLVERRDLFHLIDVLRLMLLSLVEDLLLVLKIDFSNPFLLFIAVLFILRNDLLK